MPKALNIITGDTFANLTVLKEVARHKRSNKRQFLCRCICGQEKIIGLGVLRDGTTKSCGCLRLGLLNNRNKGKRKPREGFIENHSAWDKVFRYIKRNAEHRGKLFTLTFKDIIELCQRPCSYCGNPHSNYQKGTKYQKIYFNGLDRVDNTKGYTKSNVVPCCKYCNRAKGDMTLQDFKKWIQSVSKRMEERS